MNLKEGANLFGVFIFFILLRVLVLFFYGTELFRFVDVMAVFVAYISFKLKLKNPTFFFTCWLAGLVEDIFSGTVLGINAFSKLTMGLVVRLVSEKIELGHFALQIIMLIIILAVDVIVKYTLISSVLHMDVSQGLVLNTTAVKIAINTILFVAVKALLR